jgi:hypothetical protein
MRPFARASIVLVAVLAARGAWGQTPKEPWNFSASVAYYLVPDAVDFWNPIFTADHGRLHLEARHNYVADGTNSLWAGVNFTSQETKGFAATLLFGGVFGTVEGAGVGYELTFDRRWFSLLSQGEFIYDWMDETGDSLYSWTEVTGSPTDWCRLGLALQTTHDYGLPDDIQPGAVVAFTYKRYAWEVDVLDPFRDGTTVILTFTVSFGIGR